MQRISKVKRLGYDSYLTRMQQRLTSLEKHSEEVIAKIPGHEAGVPWDVPRLLEQWDLKRAHHLNFKECEGACLQRCNNLTLCK